MSADGSPEFSSEIRQAKAIAYRVHMFIVTVQQKTGLAFVLYRKGSPHARAERIARRTDPAEMLRLVKRLASPTF
jgi:hypothetical protein